MTSPQPQTLEHLAADGVFAATAHDMCWRRLDTITGTEINFPGSPSGHSAGDSPNDDVPVEVRLYTASGSIDVPGRRIAVVADATWTWTSSSPRSEDIAQLLGAQPVTEMLLAAARTVEGGNVILIGDQADGAKAAVSVDITQAQPAKRGFELSSPSDFAFEQVLIEGIGDPLIGKFDEVRAVTAFAQARGLTIEETESGLRLSSEASDGHAVTVEFLDGHISDISPASERNSWRIEDITADGYFTAIDHAMWLAANYPNAAKSPVPVNLETGHVLLDEARNLEAKAVVIATVSQGIFTWAWADPQLNSVPTQAPVNQLRRFGTDKLVPALVRQHMPAATARELSLPQVAMPILNMWKVVTVKLNDTTTGIALIDSPELQLPALTPKVEAAVLGVQPPAHIDSNRAFEAYKAIRG